MTFAESSLQCTWFPAWITLLSINTCLLHSQNIQKEMSFVNTGLEFLRE